MRKHTKYTLVGRIKTKTINISTSLLLVLASLGGIVPFLASEHAFAATLNVCLSGCDYTSIQAAIDAAGSGDTVSVAAGTYNETGINVDKSVSLIGAPGAEIVVPVDPAGAVNAINIQANDVTVSGFTIVGPAVSTSYKTFAWGNDTTRGIAVSIDKTNFNITGNTIEGLRNDILVDGHNNTGNITGNTIDNSKSGISVQYTDGTGVTISGNHEGTFGNDWGVNLHLNGHYNGDIIDGNTADKIAPDAPAAAQQVVKDLSSNNGSWTVQDQGYSTSNRTAVHVANGGIATAQGDPLGPIDTIQTGVNAVVTGGTVNVANGTYNESFAVTKDGVKVVGQSQAGVKVISSGTTPTGQAVTVIGAAGVSLSKMTFSVGSTGAPSYDFHSYQASNLTLSDLTFSGPGSSHTPKLGGVDINSTDGVTLNNVSIDGYSKNGLSFTAQNASGDPITKNVSITDVSSTNNAWSGMAFYNTTSTGANGHDITGVSFGGTNHLTGNGQVGLFVEGASDAQVASQTTPLYGITDGSGSPVNIHTTLFSGNGIQIYNYQPYGLTATSAQFDGLTGAAMTAAQRTTTDGTIIDHLDQSTLGLVTYYTVAPDAPTNPQWLNHDGDVLGAYTNVNLVTPSWAAPATGGVDHYEYSFTSPTDSNWSAPESFTGTSIPDQSFYGAGDNGTEGPWQFRVRSVNAAGDSSAWVESPVLTYDKTAPTGLANQSPADGTVGTTASLTAIHWTTASDANGPVSYYYESSHSNTLNPDGSFTNHVYQSGALSDTQIPTPNTPEGTYYWHVRAVDAAGNSTAWTGAWKIVVDNTAPTAPLNLRLTDSSNHSIANGGVTNSFSATAAWDAVPDTDHYVYKVWDNIPGNTYNGEANAYIVDNSGTSRTGEFNQGEGTYTLEVQAVDAANNASAWSAPFNVTYDTTAPSTPTLVSPANGGFETTHDFNFDWNDSTDANAPIQYEWESSLSPATAADGSFQSPLASHTLSTSEVASPGTPDGTYYWHVKAVDAAGNASGWSSTWNVTVDTAAPATPVAAPGAGDYATSQLVTLSSTGSTTIYYTTDGSTPSSTNGTHYTGAFTVSSSETVEAIAYDAAGNASDVLTAVYTITPVVTTGGNNTNVTITNSNFQVAQTGNAQVLGDSTGGNAQSGDATNTNTTQVLGDSTTTPNGGQVEGDSTALKTNADTIKNSNFMVLGWWWIIVLAAIVGFFLLIGRRRTSEEES